MATERENTNLSPKEITKTTSEEIPLMSLLDFPEVITRIVANEYHPRIAQ